MSIKRTIITTATIVVAVAMVASVVGAQTPTIAQLMTEIAALQAQLQGLSGSQTAGTGGTGACTGVTFTRNLTVGATGSDVKCLQQILNQSATTQVSVTGAGSPGNETSYFGPKTLVAVRKYQAAHGMTPANQVGPMTRASLNAALGTTTTTLPQGCTSTSGFSPITGASCATGVVVVTPTGAGLSVMLASDNPAAGSVLSGTSSGQSQAPLAKLVFVNGDNAPVKVTTLRLQRTGVSGDAALSAVYLFNGATRLTDAASVSSGVIGFNDSTGLFTVPSGSSIEITVAADMASGLSGGTVGVALNAATDIVTNASSVRGNFPVSGNQMAIVNSGTNLATAYFSVADTGVSDVSPSGTTSSSGVDPQSDYPVWYTNLNVSINNGVVKMSRLALQEIGSINYSDIQNFRLFVDGTQVGSGVANLDANGYVTFDLTSNPVSMSSGSRQVKVLADLVGGSSRYFTFRLRNAADVTLTDSQYNVTITATDASSGTTHTINSLRSCYISSAYSCYINYGATTTTKTSDSPSGNVINGATNAVLGRWTLKANGEPIKVDSLEVYAKFYNTVAGAGTCGAGGYCTTPTLRNAALYANGVQIGSSFSLSTDGSSPNTVSLGSSLIVNPLTPVTLELKADIYDNTGVNDFDSTDTLLAYLVTQTGNGTGQVSATSVNVPSGTLAGNTLTITTGSMELAKQANYSNQSIVVPQTNYKLAAWNLTGNNSEAVNVNTIAVNFTPVSPATAGFFDYSDLSNVYVKYGSAGNVTTTKTSVAATGTSWSVSNFTVPVNGVVPVEVWADIGSSIPNTSSLMAESTITGLTASSAQSVTTSTMVDGQVITGTTGSFTGTKDATSAVTEIVPDNNTIQAAAFKFTAVSDSYKITKLTFTLGDAAGVSDVSSVSLMEGTTTLATLPGAATIVFNLPTSGAGSVQVVPGTPKVLTVSLQLGTIGVGAGTTDGNVTVTLGADSKAIAGASGVEAAMTIGTGAGSTIYAYASIPTITNVALPTTVLTGAGSTNVISKFQVSSGGTGTVSWNKVILTVTKTATPTIADASAVELWDADSNTKITCSNGAGGDGVSASMSGSGTSGTITFVTTNEQEVSGAKTYLVKAVVGGSVAANDSIVTHIAQPSGHSASSDYATIAAENGAADTFVWSDESAQSHSTSTTDWANDYLVKNLPTDSQTLSK